MSTNHARDDWADARTDEALRRELDALAGLGASASGLDGALGAVRRRVRRRRSVKQAGIAATTLAVAAGLVLGGAALLPDAPQPLPGPATSPTPSPSPSGDPSPDEGSAAPSPPEVAMTETGYQPSWLEGTDLVCGMRFDDLPAKADGHRLELLGDPTLEDDTSADGTETVQTWRAPTRLTMEQASDAGLRVSAPTLLWQEGAWVVDVGVNTTEGGIDQVGDAPADREAEDSTLSTCFPDRRTVDGVATDEFRAVLGAGTYQVRAFVQLWTSDLSDVELVVSDPVTVTLEDPTAGTASATAPEGASNAAGPECSARGLDLPDPDVAGLPEAVQVTAVSLFDAARSCDDERLTALAEAADRHDLNWGGQPPAELLALPGAEDDEEVYAILARLLSGTTPCEMGSDGREDADRAYAWPRMDGGVCQATAEDWRDAVDAGALTEQEAQEWSTGPRPDYEGWRLTIDGEGRWMQFVDGYIGPPRGE
ncbi:hypothetical protein ACH436_17960 [Isoptericola sp. NPDC019693]|uniref:hypothetical protein n=1 Tax=Isoptericola sp. NPDC019693 TaxID=3364009 RepID=UPI0037A1D23B